MNTPKAPVPPVPDASNSSDLVDFELHQGPLPPPKELARYDRALPGAAHRILKIAERDQRTYLGLLWANWFTQFAKMLVGQAFLYLLVVAAVYLAMHDKPLEAFFAGLAPIVITIYANTRKNPDAKD